MIYIEFLFCLISIFILLLFLIMQSIEIEKECRICLDTNNNSRFISPCKCKGTNKWVHEECLNKWRLSNINKDAFNKCTVCKENYILKINNKIKTYHFSINTLIISNVFLTLILFMIISSLNLFINSFSLNIINLGTSIENTYLEDYNENNFLFYYFNILDTFLLIHLFNILYFYIKLKFNVENKNYFSLNNKKNIYLNLFIFILIYFFLFTSKFINDFLFFFIPTSIIILFIPFVIYNMYFSSNLITKKIIKENIEILSFEENPLLNV